MRPVALAGILASTTILGGCAATIGGISLSSISSFAGFASTLFTGADLGEHAASLITGKDCRFSEGLLREDRDICEEPGSLATRDDFHGIFVDRIDADGTVIYAAPKYMTASVGAGENENDPDKIWAEIKTQKAKEENQRQLARAKATQTIDVAALATGSLSPEALAFLPSGAKTDPETVLEGDTASQAAAGPRAVVNAAGKSRRAAKVQAPAPAPTPTQAPIVKTPEVGPIIDQPAIDEKMLAAQLRRANGSGGPLISSAASSAPVTSKIVNGEPVVILRIGPIASTGMAASAQPAETMSAEFSTVPTTTLAAQPTMQPASAPSPQAILALKPAASATKQSTLEVDKLDPQMPGARPRRKPNADLVPAAPREVAAAEMMEEIETAPAPALLDSKPKKRTAKPVEVPADVDIYRAPVLVKPTAAPDPINAPYRPADAAYSPDVPQQQESPASAAAFAGSDETAPATNAPAQLVPVPQE